jgi:hypothetical protein
MSAPPNDEDEQVAAGALGAVATAIRQRVGVDPRALAAFRVAVGALLLADLALRSRHLVAFYTDDGVLPRAALSATKSTVYSIHALSGATWVQAVLFVLAGAVAFALFVGYRTRAATIGSWLLLTSLQLRNPLVLNAGDELLRFLLLWGIFLPLGARWSLDARRETRTRTRSTVASVATAALLLQVVLMYATNAVHKSRSEEWMRGDALVSVFDADQFTVLLGTVLADQHVLLGGLGYLWMGLVVLAPLLVLLTGAPRAVLATLFVVMHLGMVVTMRLGLFPLIVVAGLLPLFPPAVWTALSNAAARHGFEVDRPRQRLRTVRPGPGAVSVPGRPLASLRGLGARATPRPRARAVVSTVLPAVILLLVVLGNVQAVGYTVPGPAEEAIERTRTEQEWRMFAPNPAQTTRWYVAPGTLANGSRVDALHGGPVTWDHPAAVAGTYPTARWRKYLSNVRTAEEPTYRTSLARYLCDRWKREHDTRLETVSVYDLADRSGPGEDTTAIRKTELATVECSRPPGR